MKNLINQNFIITKVVYCYKNHLPKGKIRTLSSPARPCHCFAFVLSGETEYVTDSFRKFTVKAGDVLYLSQKEKYVIDVKTDDYKVIVIDFYLNANDKLKSDSLKCNNLEVKSLFEKAVRIYDKESSVKNAKLIAVANEIYATLLEEKDYSSSKEKECVSLATEYIRNNFERPSLSSSEIANVCKISEVHLRRLFKKVLGVSPLKYVNDLRFDKAEKLLSVNEIPISQIAESSGFSDAYYFSKAYKKRYGYAPSKRYF